jgi:hypothetical protein
MIVASLALSIGVVWAEPSGEAAWLLENAFEFETAEAGHGFEDLEPLRASLAMHESSR